MRTIKTGFLTAVIITTLVAIGIPTVKAEDNIWRYELTPYAYIPLSMEINPAITEDETASASPSISQILDLLDFAGMVRFEAWKGDWGFIFDIMYADFGADGSSQTALGPVISANIDFRLAYVDFGISRRYEIASPNNKGRCWIEPIAGIRYSYLKQELDLKISFEDLADLGEPKRTLGGHEGWLEPFIGFRVKWELNHNIAFFVRGDMGGFGIGNASDLTWNLITGLDYKPWASTSLKFGYRINSIDYDTKNTNDRLALDATLMGPVLAITFHF